MGAGHKVFHPPTRKKNPFFSMSTKVSLFENDHVKEQFRRRRKLRNINNFGQKIDVHVKTRIKYHKIKSYVQFSIASLVRLHRKVSKSRETFKVRDFVNTNEDVY